MRGDLNSIRWIEGPITPDCQHKDLVRIIYASINFKDVMITSGKIFINQFSSRGRLEDCFIGFEYVGIDTTGHRVMGICENRYDSYHHVDEKSIEIMEYFQVYIEYARSG